MSATSQTRITDQKFRHRREELRSKIDLVPEDRQSELRAYADVVEKQHDQMQRTCARVWDLVADLGLIVAHTRFHVEACCREAEQARKGRRLD